MRAKCIQKMYSKTLCALPVTRVIAEIYVYKLPFYAYLTA